MTSTAIRIDEMKKRGNFHRAQLNQALAVMLKTWRPL
jgi:hypothetical protein